MALDAVLGLLTIWNVFSAAVILFVTYRVVNGLVLSPLKSVPGSVWHALSPIGVLYHAIEGKVGHVVLQKHLEYGSLVRIGPVHVSTCDPQLAQRILRVDDLPKSWIYDRLKSQPDDPQDLLTTRDRDWHRRNRRLVSPGFSISYLNNLEPLLQSVWQSFEDKAKALPKDVRGFSQIDMNAHFHFIAMDVIGETAFGATMHMVSSGSHPYYDAIKNIFALGAQRVLLPFLPDSSALQNAVDTERDFLGGAVQARETMNREGKKRADILQMLLDAVDPDTGERLDTKSVMANAKLMMAAGSETTANSMMWTLYFLMKNPTVLAKLQSELDTAFPSGLTEPLHQSTLKALPYLQAVIKESMRLRPVAPQFSRETNEDIVVEAAGEDGAPRKFILPAKTIIQISIMTLHRHPKIWLRAEEFWPERWLTAPVAEQDDDGIIPEAEGFRYGHPSRVNKDAFLSFSIGSRDCIGRTFAWNEMRLVIGHLVRRFDLEPAFDVTKDIEGVAFVTLQNRTKEGLPIRIRPRK